MVAVPVTATPRIRDICDLKQRVAAKIAYHSAIHAKAYEKRDGYNLGTDKQSEMNTERVVHIIDAKANDKCEPVRAPN